MLGFVNYVQKYCYCWNMHIFRTVWFWTMFEHWIVDSWCFSYARSCLTIIVFHNKCLTGIVYADVERLRLFMFVSYDCIASLYWSSSFGFYLDASISCLQHGHWPYVLQHLNSDDRVSCVGIWHLTRLYIFGSLLQVFVFGSALVVQHFYACFHTAVRFS